MASADQIDALLPQTQCQRCGYADCRSYAEAISRGETGINRCPPGGEATLKALAELTGGSAGTLDPAVGAFEPGTVARIEEPHCIGCTKCIQACPVDAIVGAAKQMHAVIETLCTGCGLCLPPCPVDCIRLEPARGVTRGLEGWRFPLQGMERAAALRGRYAAYRRRRARDEQARQDVLPQDARSRHQAEIAAALARVRARRAQTSGKA